MIGYDSYELFHDLPVYSSLEFPTHWESNGNKEIILIPSQIGKNPRFYPVELYR